MDIRFLVSWYNEEFTKAIMIIFFIVIGIVLYLFSYWKRLKDDYSANQIFGSAISSVLLLAFFLLFIRFMPQKFWFWVVFLSLSLTLVAAVKHYKMRLFDAVDSFVFSYILMAIFVFMGVIITKTRSVELLSSQAAFFGLFLFFWFMDKKYIGFTWYKSGKVGFPGLFTLGLFFLMKCVLAAIFSDVVLFGGTLDIIFSGFLAFVFFLMIFSRARDLK